MNEEEAMLVALRLRAECLEREIAELTAEKTRLATIVDGIKQAVLNIVVLPKMGCLLGLLL